MAAKTEKQMLRSPVLKRLGPHNLLSPLNNQERERSQSGSCLYGFFQINFSRNYVAYTDLCLKGCGAHLPLCCLCLLRCHLRKAVSAKPAHSNDSHRVLPESASRRPKLKLLPRTVDKPLLSPAETARNSSIFGTGKPRDETVVEATRSRNTSESSQN